MNRFFIRYFLFIAAVGTLSFSCASGYNLRTIFKQGAIKGSGNVVSESRKVSGFSKIDFSIVGSLDITQGDKEFVTIESDDNILPIIETVVDGDTLKIRSKDGTSFNTATKLKVTVSLIKLDYLGVSGVGDVNIGALKTSSIKIVLSGAGKVEIETLNADSMKAEVAGVGILAINSGKVNSQAISISGAGSFNGENLVGNSGKVSLFGCGSAKVNLKNISSFYSGCGSIKNFYRN